ncbi:unnamed protein product [Adineta steineri]|uniref:ADP ribosyltransferase domain-containing protein n=2 Tax=Adineta steineri TaxID=433720 RepID=A0A819A486_9BILA|nr:unnamed protein product [Adineta steineri]CAF4026519.1 unnamed protein product [Adineta steineri]
MSRKTNDKPKYASANIGRNVPRQQNENVKQTSTIENANNLGIPFKAIVTANRRYNVARGSKDVLPPIPAERSSRDNEYNNADDSEEHFGIIDEGCLPLKLFDGKKQSLSELSEESMSYLWFRRIKEIFLRMDDGKDGQEDDPFVEFDMNLARIDLMNTCDQYIENERIAATKKDTKISTTTKNSKQTDSSLSIDDCVNELNNLIKSPSSGDSSSVLSKCIGSLHNVDKRIHDVIDKLQKNQTQYLDRDVRTGLELLQALQTKEKKVKSDLEKKQEWDMKKLYAEVFKMSYKRNRLRTTVEREELTPIKRGDDQPNFNNAIWWYSCDKANIYYQINSILRLENFELLMAYRYYVSDLCRMIEFMYQERKREQGDVAQTFYRAGNISKAQLKKMNKQQKGQFISLIGFISTTTDMGIAKGYARKQHISEDNERALFQINIKPQEPCTAFAYIEGISFHPEEKEVLFSMGSTFIVDTIIEPKNGENFYTVQLTASDIDKTLIDDIRIKVEDCSPSGRAALLAQYLMELGEYRAARKYLNSLLSETNDGGVLINDPNLANIYSCLGMTYARQGLHGDALKVFKQALNTQARLEYSNNNALANIHNNIGLTYVGLGYMNEAEETLAEALRIQVREVNSNQQHLASIYGDIGYVHYMQRNFSKASVAFEKAEKIYKKSSDKIAHDALEQSLKKAEYLTNYGHLLSVGKSLTEAQERYTEALKLYKSILPESDPKLMQTHINIMLAYAENENYNEITKWFEDTTVQKLIDKQEANMFELSSSVTQASLAFLHEFVGACYVTQSEATESKHSSEQQIPGEFCLGLLHAELYNLIPAIENLKKTVSSVGLLDDDMKLAAYLLLANLYKQQFNYQEAIENFNQALKVLKQLNTQKDRVLEIEISLTRIECLSEMSQTNDALVELHKLEKSLKVNDTDTKCVSLKVIVYDTLARYYLIQKEYDLFDRIAEKSVIYKLRSFSPYHPSLVVNLKLMAERYSLQSRYHEALYFYERALEVQSLNLAINHPQNRRIWYAMGDIYCKLDKLSNAKEKYDVAENKNSNTDEDDILPHEKIKCEESMEILIAQISMHQHLATLYAKQKEYEKAISEINEVLDLLKEQLPSSAFEMDDNKVLIQKNIDASVLFKNLQLLANCYLYLGDILGSAQDDEMGYQAALNIYEKLYRYDQESVRDKLILSYQKLSKYHEDLSNDSDALEYFQEITDLEEPSSATLYRLALLNVACNEQNEAVKIFEKLLANSSINESQEIKQIIEENLENVQRKIKNQRWNSTRHPSNFHDSDSSDTMSSSSPESPRHATNEHEINMDSDEKIENTTEQEINMDSDKKIGNTDDSSDDRAKARAYSELDDIEKSLKFYEKYIKSESKNIQESTIYKTQLQKIEQDMYVFDQQSVFIFLPKLLNSLVEKVRNASLEDSDILKIADSYFQCALLYDKLGMALKSSLAYISAFDRYISKSTNDIKTVTDLMTEILNSYIDHELTPERILEFAKKLSWSSDGISQMSLKIAAMYRDNEIDDVEDEDGDGDTSNESRTKALEWYRDCLNTTNNVLAKGGCYYNILCLYRDYIYEDDEGKKNVNDLISLLPKFNTSDRRVLLDLACRFMKEYDDNKDICDKKTNDQLQKHVKTSFSENFTENDELSIGCYLIESDDLSSAEEYWNSIVKQLEHGISSQVLSLIRASHSTFNQILNAVKYSEKDIILLFNQLTKAYEKIGDYYILQANSSQVTDTDGFQQAASMYKLAAHLMKRLNSDTNTINKVEKKYQEANSQAKPLKK